MQSYGQSQMHQKLQGRNSTTKTPVKIFCNLQKALRVIQHIALCNEHRFSIDLINHKAEELQCDGYLVSILWIPSHSDLTENEKSNLALKSKAQEKENKLYDDGAHLHILKVRPRYSPKNVLNDMQPDTRGRNQPSRFLDSMNEVAT